MSSASVKRARVTARIAQAEHTSLPTDSENTQHLLEQTEGKRKQLDKKCGEYEQICKKFAKLKAEKNRLETDHSQLTSQSDEVDQVFKKLEQSAEGSFLSQQQKNNEMNEAVQQWNALDGKEEKLYEDLMHEAAMEKDLQEKCSEVSKNVEHHGRAAKANAKEHQQLETAFDTDMKTEKVFPTYIALFT
ncbi:unnamed protein product [Caenorhabditis sp. 36 PRJEB53466]|nr:unnamed protein product [Caenorhabditis sp. 36 PRJEB53466]